MPSFAPGDPDWIKQAGLVNHDIETAEEFWSFARKFRNQAVNSSTRQPD
jgi:hypothetical protein